MNRSPRQVLRFLLQAAWRRRWLLIIPVLIMVPVGLVAAKFMPRTYVTQSLMMLQESGETNPLAPESGNAQFVTNEERLAALRALLLSDRVLGAALDDFGITGAKLRAEKAADLRSTVWLDGAGANFIQIFHSGQKPVGLGKELENVILHFLEALVPDKGEPDAIEMLLQKHTRDLAAANASKADLKRRLAALSIDDLPATQARLEELSRSLSKRAEELRQADKTVQEATPEGLSGITTVEQLDREVARLAKSSEGNAVSPSVRAEDVAALREALAKRMAAASEQQRAATLVAAEQQKISAYNDLTKRIAATERDIAADQEQVEATRKRLDAARLTSATGILRAPDLIRIVDPPRDPEFPTRSPIIYLFAALAAGVLLGLALASIAEFLDTRLRDPEEFSEVAGVPVITRIANRRHGHLPLDHSEGVKA
jgi:uncharacterized protein involved in exopolysaccharide biosynthesis